MVYATQLRGSQDQTVTDDDDEVVADLAQPAARRK